MELTKKEIEIDEYFINDGCEFRRSQETIVVNSEVNTKHNWLYKSKPNESIDGSNWSHWLYCSDIETEELELKYKQQLWT